MHPQVLHVHVLARQVPQRFVVDLEDADRQLAVPVGNSNTVISNFN